MCVWVLVSVYVCVVCAGVRAAAGAAATPRTMQHMRQFSSNRSHVRIVGPTWFGVVGFGLVHALRDPSLNADKNIIKNCCTRMLRRITELIIFATAKILFGFLCALRDCLAAECLKELCPSLGPLFLVLSPFLFSLSLSFCLSFSCLMAEQFA